MASIRRHPETSNRWQVRYRDPAGRQRTKNFGLKSDAEKYASIIEADKLRGAWTDPKLAKTSVEDWSRRWLATKVNLKPKTRAGYESLLKTHILPVFGELALGGVQPLQVREWVAHLENSGLSPSRIRQAYQLLSAVLKTAVEAGFLSRSPCIGADLPRIRPREMRFLTAEQVNHLAQSTADPYGTLIYLMAYGGLRWGEAVALRRSRCELLRSRIRVTESVSEVGGKLHFGPTKTWRNRDVIIPQFLVERLATHLARSVPHVDGFVFTSPRRLPEDNASGVGRPLRHSNFRKRVWMPATAATGLDGLRLHDLRHTTVALSIAEGAHPKAIQVLLGHSSIAVTMDLYGHLFPSDQEDLASRLDRRYQASLAV